MSPMKSILPLALGGLLIGLMLGAIVAGAYASWVTGRDATNVGFTTILDFFPAKATTIPNQEPIRTALLLWGGLALAAAIALPLLGMKRPLSSHGSARWATEREMKEAGLRTRLKTLNGPIYGKLGDPASRADFLSSRDIPHSLVSAPTGSGKTAGIVIPTLLTYPGSIFCLDVKGELFAKTSRRRVAFGDKVFKFAPYDPEDRTHRYNPLQDVADAPPRRRFTEARRLAASFIIAHGNGQGFLDGAREIFAATALVVIERETPTIGAIFDALSQPGEAFATLRKLGDEAKAEEAKKIFYKMSGMEARILSSYLSVLSDGGLNVWADPAVRAATSASDFSIQTLRSKPTSIYIVVSDNDLVPLAPLIRLMFQQTIAIIQRSEPDLAKGEKYTVLFCLDEFASLGVMEMLVSAISTLRGYGGRVMIVIQTIAQLRKLYTKDGASVFLANCRMQIFMAPADEDTPNYISEAIGDFTRKSRSKSWKGGELTTSYQEREDGARLIRPEQVRMIGEDHIVALVQNSYPLLVNKVIYYKDKVLNAIYESQKGPLPEPPVLSDDPRPVTMEPIVPGLPGGGAANPLVGLKPAPEENEATPKPVATDDTNNIGKADVDGEVPMADAASDAANAPVDDPEERVVMSARDKSRGLVSAVGMAERMYRTAIVAEEKSENDDPVASSTASDKKVYPEPTDETGSAEPPKDDAADQPKPRKARKLKKSSLAEAKAKHAGTPEEPEP